jgi:FAD-linked oxidoreductase
VQRPADVAEIGDALRRAEVDGLPVRVLGSGHSFTPAAATDGVALDMAHWTGVRSADPSTGLVTVLSGTTLRDLNATLDGHALAMPNLGDIDAQTVAGAISTGTHGTGARFGGLASQVAALELVLADGSLVRCSRTENPDLFDAARVSLGALGVIATVTLRCEPSFVLSAVERPEPLDSVLSRFDALAEENDHFECYWFPYGDSALVKANNRLRAGSVPRPLSPVRRLVEYELMENAAFGALCRVGRAVPRLVRPLGRLSSSVLSSRSYSDRSHRVFVTARKVRFVESEYAVPRESMQRVLDELRRVVPRLNDPVMFPVEMRTAAADDAWLSTGYARDNGYIAVHQYAGMPYREYFDAFERIACAAGGRPHWGKLHSLTADELRLRYPRFDDFLALRDKLDPGRRFENPYLRRVLGP